MYSAEMGILHYLVGWILVGSIAGYFLFRLSNPVPFIALVAFWFMPSTIICGAATVMPWLSVVPYAFSVGNCAGAFSLAFSLFANITIVYIVRMLYLRFKQRAINHA